MKTNKTFKKVAATATAAILASCAMIPMTMTNVSAATINISNAVSGHTYAAYQIFDGTLSGSTLSNVVWGSGISNETSALNAVKAITLSDSSTPFSSCGNAADVAEKLSGNSDDSEIALKFADVISDYLNTSAAKTGSSSITVDETGYYLVKDSADLTGDNVSYTSYIVEVIGNSTNIEVKTGLPTLVKKVKDVNDSTGAETAYQDSADYDIGDKVPFQLTATVPPDYKYYEKYQFIIHDTLEQGLTFDSSSVVITDDSTPVDSSTYSVVTSTTDGSCSFEIKFSDLKAVNSIQAGDTITIEYKATLNENAVIGSTGNANTAKLEYSNDPNDETGAKTGTTPADTVRVFTYEVDITKVKDNTTEELTGAKFTLQKFNGTIWEDIDTLPADTTPTSKFVFRGLDDGKYKLIENEAPEGYNKLSNDIEFEITAEHEVTSDNPQLTSLTDNHDDFTADKNSGIVSANIENKAGSVLPSTGGIGTTPFYIGGGILVAAAGVYIIVRKRMKKSESNDEE